MSGSAGRTEWRLWSVAGPGSLEVEAERLDEGTVATGHCVGRREASRPASQIPELTLAGAGGAALGGARAGRLRMPRRAEHGGAAPAPDALVGGLLAELERIRHRRPVPHQSSVARAGAPVTGAWQRLALANGNLADAVASPRPRRTARRRPAGQLQLAARHARWRPALWRVRSGGEGGPGLHRRARQLRRARDDAQRHAGRHGRHRAAGLCSLACGRRGSSNAQFTVADRSSRACATPTPWSKVIDR